MTKITQRITHVCLKKLINFQKENAWYNFFNFERRNITNFLQNILIDKDLTESQKADKAIKKINTILVQPKKFDALRQLLKEIKKDLLSVLYPKVFNYHGEPDWHTYENINTLPIGMAINSEGYFCKRTLMGGWLEFNNYDPTLYEPTQSDLGWKLHFSFDRTNSKNLEKGINIVLQALIDYKIPSFKIIPANKSISDKIKGKDITVYISDNRPLEEWSSLLTSIEEALINGNVDPGQQAKETKKIEGSQFVSYRNDKSAEGTYIQTAFNDAGEQDQLQEIKINIDQSPTFRKGSGI